MSPAGSCWSRSASPPPRLASDESSTFGNAEPDNVYVGGQSPVKYERNPQIMQNCGRR